MRSLESNGRQRESDGPWTRVRENATGIASLLVTAFWLGAMFTGQSWWLAALLVGYIAVVPLVALLFGDEADRREWWDDWATDSRTESDAEDEGAAGDDSTDARDALETLRDRYAAGELTDEQFEHKLERLLETETLEDAEQWRREGRDERNRERDGRDPEPAYES
ncbi:SHOCT domain-containing protein [Natronorubrum thiooxidans]|uniref:Short C-terminal domain-containing protein n=1 Tax=Natronorubrum thiooxidans TaxID=308853 RepID=A0A1N7FVB0_9EURY|nr:SHOCT domain-containing protein [Natronorubrum thiooxidans]SIS04282.1 Short C-terminal domain-containing protein [Natronorubrum thiooxidans]